VKGVRQIKNRKWSPESGGRDSNEKKLKGWVCSLISPSEIQRHHTIDSLKNEVAPFSLKDLFVC
jgi:hypothetical protein